MKKFLKNLCLVVIVGGIMLTPFGNYQANAFIQFIPGAISALSGGSSVVEGNTSQGAKVAGEQNKNSAGVNATLGCIKTMVGVPFGLNLEACTAAGVYLIMWVFSWVLWLSGKILDISVYYTINMADLLTHVPVVDIGWKIFRDLANIFFIFILLWIAIGTILGLNSGKTKELLVNLVVVALLMNFSLFITKAVIDASNIVALHFYDLIVSPNPGGNPPVSSLAGAFMEGLAIQTLYEPQTVGGQSLAGAGALANNAAQNAGGIINMGKIILIGILGIILMMTAAYVFFVAAILFIIRVVVLMMIMILSPLAFLGFILPATEHYAEQWKEQLIHQSLFAPIYLALCYVVIKAIQSPAFKSGVMSVNAQDTTAATRQTVISAAALVFGNGAGQGSTAGLSFIFNFILLIGLMLASIIVAKKMEAVGVEFAEEAGKSARGFVGRNIMRGKYITVAGGAFGYGAQGAGAVIGRIPGLKNVGDKISGIGKKTVTGADNLQRKVDIAELDKKFKDSRFGASGPGTFIREITTGGKLFGTKATFGGEKSVHEAYEEDEHLRERVEEIDKVDETKKAKDRLMIAQMEYDNFKNTHVPPPLRTATMTDAEYASELEKDSKKRKEIEDDLREKVDMNKSIVGRSISKVSSQGFINMDEHSIEGLIEFATTKQVDALMEDKSGRWTFDEKKKFLAKRYAAKLSDFKRFDEDNTNYEQKQHDLMKAVGENRIKRDASGNIVVDSNGKAQKIDPATGNLTGETLEIPTQPDIKNYPGLKDWARNEMTLHEYELMNMVNPEAFENQMLVGTMRWGVIQELRRSGYFDLEQRKKMRYTKDKKMKKLVDKKDEHYLEENTEDERRIAFEQATINTDNSGGEIDKLVDADEAAKASTFAASEAAKKAKNPAYIIKTYLPKTKSANPKEFAALVAKKQREVWSATMKKMVAKDVMRQEYLESVLTGRAANEIAGMPGPYRNSATLHKGVGSSVLKQWKDKDTEDIQFILGHLFESYKRDREGIEEMTFQNKQALKWLLKDRDGRSFFTDKLDNLELQRLREELMDTIDSGGDVTFRSDEDKFH